MECCVKVFSGAATENKRIFYKKNRYIGDYDYEIRLIELDNDCIMLQQKMAYLGTSPAYT